MYTRKAYIIFTPTIIYIFSVYVNTLQTKIRPDTSKFLTEPYSLFIAPNYLGSGNVILRPCIPLAVYCVKLVVSDRRVANKVNFILDNMLNKSYNTTPAEEEKALEIGVRFPALKGL